MQLAAGKQDRPLPDAAASPAQTGTAELLEDVPLPLHWLDRDGTILWANRAARDLLGNEAAPALGRHVGELFADGEGRAELLRCLARGESLRGHPATLRALDGSLRHVLVDAVAKGPEGDPVHTQLYLRDITEQKR